MNNTLPKSIRILADEIIRPLVSEIKRSEMPQLGDKSIPEVLEVFDQFDIKYQQGSVTADKLLSTQENTYNYKINKMVHALSNGEMTVTPLFISMDGYILDGHHRHKAYVKLYGEQFSVPVIKIYLKKLEALKLFRKAVEESTQAIQLNPDIISEFITCIDMRSIIKESSATPNAPTDDGPATFYRNIAHYKEKTKYVPDKLGFEIMNYLVGNAVDFADHSYRYNTVPVVSFGNDEDGKAKYYKHITTVARRLGYEIIDFMDVHEAGEDNSNTPHTYTSSEQDENNN